MSSPIILLTDQALDVQGPLADFSALEHIGAVSSFTGQVRGGDGLTALELQHHPVLTPQALEQIAEAAMSRFSLAGLVLAHRYGRMTPGEPIVFIAAAASHRRASLDAVSFLIDTVKTQAPFWKREWRGETYEWIEPTAEDHAAARQWLEAAE
ncbi:molybdenum cofactor biosynthesis protein MoaE [Hyphobacterium sp.]|uniref:molybdenum cofactor biosynthesis protein MoaE n=1 Tax=Hyphobacterium sp. TaxID=2004662 RepID=UPI003BAB35E6